MFLKQISDYLWAIVEHDKFVGVVAGQRVRDDDPCQICFVNGRWVVKSVYNVWYFVRRSAQGKGHATAAATAVLEWLLDKDIATSVVTDCDEDNAASKAVSRKMMAAHPGRSSEEIVDGHCNYVFSPLPDGHFYV